MNKIMLLEDDESIRENLTELLKTRQYQVVSAKNVKEFTNLIEEGERADIYLLDVILPDGDGFLVCQFLRKYTTNPIIFLTSVDDEMSISKGLNIGGDDYVVKPFRIMELQARIQANLRRIRSVEEEQILVMPDNLTATEAKLWEILVLNKGLIVKREKLLEHMWDERGVFVDNNTLTVTISRLKTKIKGCNIETIRGIGYRMKLEND